MRIDVITLFPEMFDALKTGIPGRAQASHLTGSLTLRTHQLRDHAINRHGQVDDAPYGGEAGMVLRPEPLRDALNAVLRDAGHTALTEPSEPSDASGPASGIPQNDEAAFGGTFFAHPRDAGENGVGEGQGAGAGATAGELSGEPLADAAPEVPATSEASAGKPHVIYMSAQGALLTQQRAAELAARPHVIIVCGHYKGVDQRFLDAHVDEELSIGDYVLSGGELPAMVLIDAVARLLPGVLGDIDSADTDSHAVPGRLGWPVYTRPASFAGRAAPEVLLSGHHANIVKWRTFESLRLTRTRRPDLLEAHPLTEAEQNLIDPPPKKKRSRKPS